MLNNIVREDGVKTVEFEIQQEAIDLLSSLNKKKVFQKFLI